MRNLHRAKAACRLGVWRVGPRRRLSTGRHEIHTMILHTNIAPAQGAKIKRKNENQTPADNLEPPAGTCGSNLPQPATSLNRGCQSRPSTITLEQHLSTTARFLDVSTFFDQVVHVGQNLLGRPPASLVSSKLSHFSLFVLFSPTFRCAAVLRLSD